jgi:hypothetical protein
MLDDGWVVITDCTRLKIRSARFKNEACDGQTLLCAKGPASRPIDWPRFASWQLENQDERLNRFNKAARCERSPSLMAVNWRPTP